MSNLALYKSLFLKRAYPFADSNSTDSVQFCKIRTSFFTTTITFADKRNITIE